MPRSIRESLESQPLSGLVLIQIGPRLFSQPSAAVSGTTVALRTRTCIAGTIDVYVERSCGARHDLRGDHHFLDAFEARQVEHGVEQDAFHDRTQPTRPGLAVDGLAGNGTQRLFRQAQMDRLHLEQPLILLYERILGLGENELEGR